MGAAGRTTRSLVHAALATGAVVAALAWGIHAVQRGIEEFDEGAVPPSPEVVFANFRRLADALRGAEATVGVEDGDEPSADVSTENLAIIERLVARPDLYKEVLARARAHDAYRFDMLDAILRKI
jgi:hypothetical protein